MKPMEETLHKIGYVGMLDMNCIIDEKTGTPWPMEWTARPGYPMWNIMMSLHEGDPAQWMLDCVKGENTLDIQEKTCVGVVIANADFPFNKREDEDYLDFPVVLSDEIDYRAVHPCEVKLSKSVRMVDGVLTEDVLDWGTAGSYIVVCTGVGDSISEARDKVYKVVKGVKVGNDPQYRTDIGEKCEKALPKLKKFGFCERWKY
jgi:phosphoribosylamine--glycine ligase